MLGIHKLPDKRKIQNCPINTTQFIISIILVKVTEDLFVGKCISQNMKLYVIINSYSNILSILFQKGRLHRANIYFVMIKN